MIFFSSTTRGFYPGELIADYEAAETLPDDLVEMTDLEVSRYYLQQAPVWKVLKGDVSGRPVWGLVIYTENELKENKLQEIPQSVVIYEDEVFVVDNVSLKMNMPNLDDKLIVNKNFSKNALTVIYNRDFTIEEFEIEKTKEINDATDKAQLDAINMVIT